MKWNRSSGRNHRAGWFWGAGKLAFRCRDRVLRGAVLVVGVRWGLSGCGLAICGPGLSERQPPPWWTCPVALGSWGSGGRFLRANPLRRRGNAETVRRRSLRPHAPRGCGFVWVAAAGRTHLVVSAAGWGVGLSVLRVVRSSERSIRLPASFVGCVLFPHGSILWARLGNQVLRCCSSEQGHALRSIRSRCLGAVRGSALRSGREVSVNLPSGCAIGPPTICSSERAGGGTSWRWLCGPGCRSVTGFLALRGWRSSMRPRVR